MNRLIRAATLQSDSTPPPGLLAAAESAESAESQLKPNDQKAWVAPDS